MYQATKPPNKVAKSLNLGRDDLYVVNDVPQMKYELEVCTVCTVDLTLYGWLK